MLLTCIFRLLVYFYCVVLLENHGVFDWIQDYELEEGVVHLVLEQLQQPDEHGLRTFPD